MIHPAPTDVVGLLRQLVKLLQPFAQSHGLSLTFRSKQKKIVFLLRPDQVIPDLTNLICNIISYTPQGNVITVTAGIKKAEFKILVSNTGINLSLVSEITRSCRQSLIVKGNSELKQTQFDWTLPVALPGKQPDNNNEYEAPVNKIIIPEYYNEIRKRLRSHFSKADNLVAQLSILYPREASFLQKVNAVIIANMENELFDTTVLSREMNMSRTSLFRRMKPLIQQAPAAYIKSIRLQKAKELLEATDISVGDAAFKTGFQNLSHFTKAFAHMFGFLPSSIRRKGHVGTKE